MTEEEHSDGTLGGQRTSSGEVVGEELREGEVEGGIAKVGEVAEGAGGDGAGEPQQRERGRVTGPRCGALVGRRRRRRWRRSGLGLGLGGEAPEEERGGHRGVEAALGRRRGGGAAASGEERGRGSRARAREREGIGLGRGGSMDGGTILMAHHTSVRHKYIHTNGAPRPGAPLVFF